MTGTKRVPRRAQVDQKHCVACGCCVKVCPLGAISIYKGLRAEVDESLVARCRNLFAQAYEVATGNTYRFAAKDYKAIAALVGKVTDATTAKNPYAGREEIERAFIWLLKHLPRWYRESGFSACIINGKFNEIVAAIKHGEGQNNKPNTGVSAEYLEAIAKGLR